MIKSYNTINPTVFNSEEIKVSARVVIGKDDGAPNFYMRVFEFSPGEYSRRHSHKWEHEMFIHSGKGEIYCDGRFNSVSAGNAVFIQPDEEHQIRNNSSGLLTVVCLVPSTAPEL